MHQLSRIQYNNDNTQWPLHTQTPYSSSSFAEPTQKRCKPKSIQIQIASQRASEPLLSTCRAPYAEHSRRLQVLRSPCSLVLHLRINVYPHQDSSRSNLSRMGYIRLESGHIPYLQEGIRISKSILIQNFPAVSPLHQNLAGVGIVVEGSRSVRCLCRFPERVLYYLVAAEYLSLR